MTMATRPKRFPRQEFTQLQSRIMTDRLRAMSEQVVTVSLASPFGLACVAYAMADVVPRDNLILWLIIAGIGHAMAITMGLLYLRRSRVTAHNSLWMHMFTLRAALIGLSWGASALIIWPEQYDHQLLLMLFLVGFTSISTISNSALRRCVIAVYFGTWIPPVTRLAMTDSHEHQSLAVMMVIFSGIMLATLLRYSRQLLDATRWRFENVELAETLQQEQSRTDSANRAKSKFLAAASHDLRQPVHALGFFLQTLRVSAERPQPDRAKLIEVTRQAQGTLKGLTGLLDTLLDFSRIEAGTIPANVESVAVRPLLHTIAHQFTERAQRKGLTLRVRPCILSVRSNPVGLQRIVGNLVENAIRYSQRGGILVGCRQRGDKLRIEVWDTGQGIPPNELDAIFDEFYQVKTSLPGSEHGLGLGLSIVKQLADLFGHKIEVCSRVGRGSRFVLTVPIAEPEIENPTMGPLTLSAISPAVSGFLLLIDDDDDSLDAQSELLAQVGYRVLTAHSADEALDLLATRSPRLAAVIADYRLAHNRTGIEAIDQICKTIGRRLPALIVTGDTGPHIDEAVAAAGYPLERKPLAPRTFLKKVRILVSRRP